MSFWRDVKRGWNVGSRTAGKAARDLGEKLGIQGGTAEDAERRAALAEVEEWHRPSPTSARTAPPSPPPPTRTTTPAPSSAASSSAASSSAASPSAPAPTPSGGDLSEPEIEDRIRRRTL